MHRKSTLPAAEVTVLPLRPSVAAIPSVQTAVSGTMFRTGVLLNSGDAIERLAEIDRVVFDKMGTPTLPELDVTNAADIPRDVFELAGQLALASHHPVAAAMARASGSKGAANRGEEIAGEGVRGLVNGLEVQLGRPSFCGADQIANEIRRPPTWCSSAIASRPSSPASASRGRHCG
jgi:Cu2+-exporting ATPase